MRLTKSNATTSSRKWKTYYWTQMKKIKSTGLSFSMRRSQTSCKTVQGKSPPVHPSFQATLTLLKNLKNNFLRIQIQILTHQSKKFGKTTNITLIKIKMLLDMKMFGELHLPTKKSLWELRYFTKFRQKVLITSKAWTTLVNKMIWDKFDQILALIWWPIHRKWFKMVAKKHKLVNKKIAAWLLLALNWVMESQNSSHASHL